MNPCVGRNFGGEDGVLKILLAPPFCVSVFFFVCLCAGDRVVTVCR